MYRARVRPGSESHYAGLLEQEVLPAARDADGLLAFHVGRRMEGSQPPEFMIITVWRDLASLQAFTGPNWHAPIFFGREESLIESFEVEHFEGTSSTVMPAAVVSQPES